ncbi:putative immunity protein [Microbacterium phosphatis]|uniref:putative immunity protein n=1 Tax=Microbacterium phosphatis TaxID=3140248 RepID=UPI003BA2F0F8
MDGSRRVRHHDRLASIQTLSDAERRAVARWALVCAERVLPLSNADETSIVAVRDAVERTRAYAEGRSTAAEEISKRFRAGSEANAATTAAGAAAARSVGQASAVAHMGAHALGAAAYAAKAVSLASPERPDAVDEEIRWQLGQLTADERAILAQLPPLGADASGPLGEGLLSRGVPGAAIRAIQAEIGSTPV